MTGQQDQYVCTECDRRTLHTREVVEFNHILHLLVTVFLIGLWLPFWFVCAISHNKYRGPFRCAHCGHALGTPSASQQAVIDLRQGERDHEADEQSRARQERLSEARKAAWARFVLFARVNARMLWVAAKRLPGRIDRVLQSLAGEGNVILYRFFEVVFVLGLLGVFAAAWVSFSLWMWTLK